MQVLASIQYDRRRQIGIGQGMNSTVYLADDPQLGGTMAVKEIEKKNFGNDVDAYFAEAQAMFRSSHPNIVEIQYACQTPSEICLAMPYYAKGSLLERIKDRPLQLTEVMRVAQGVLAGLARIHTSELVHLDVKPSNILFSNSEIPMVADFGQARQILPTGIVKVSDIDCWWIPPETIVTGTGSVLSDVYQAGLLLYSALNGEDYCEARRPPNAAVRDKIQRGKFPDRGEFLPHVPRRLRTIVRKALAVLPNDRYQSATDMADALSRVNLGRDWRMEPLPGGGRTWRSSRPGCADLGVEQVASGSGFDVRVYTERPGGPRRAKDKKSNWRSGLSDCDALIHLKTVFERLLV
jgi:eukaryotic-like serine/threonine-protein kinase